MNVLVAQLNPTIGDVSQNLKKVLHALDEARKKRAHIVLFPELTLTGYPPEDLLLDRGLIEAAERALEEIVPATRDLFVAVGLPRKGLPANVKPLYNSAAVCADGKLLGFANKILLPTYDVFDEARFFEPGRDRPAVFSYKGKRIAVTICEDCWENVGYSRYQVHPTHFLKDNIDLHLNLSASPYSYGHREERIRVFSKTAKETGAPLIVCNQVGANDQLIFDGASFACDAEGNLTFIASAFKEELILITPEKKEPLPLPKESTADLYQALVLGVRDYFAKQGFTQAVIGLSGGIDSALVAHIAKEALGASHVHALFLPSRYTSPQSSSDAASLAHFLGISFKTLSIDGSYQHFLDLLAPSFHPIDLTDQNLQARIRGLLLMAFCNQNNALLLNTGNKSELATGYTTLYGDLCGGLGVLLDLTKRRVFELARYAKLPASILARAPSAELKMHQTDQDRLPPYEILDPILEDYLEVRLTPQEIASKRKQPLAFVEKILQMVHLAEYKRRQAPMGLRVTSKCFSKGRSVPIVQKWRY